MLKQGDSVVVRSSKALNSLHLGRYNKKRGVVKKVVCSEGKPIAAYVTFKKVKEDVTILIPIKSLEGISTVNHIRTLNILKQTVL